MSIESSISPMPVMRIPALPRMFRDVRGYSGVYSWLNGWARSIWLSIQESRPLVLGVFQLRFLSGALLSGGRLTSAEAAHFTLSSLVWCCCVLSIYLYNGVKDVVEDATNHSGRPIARGDLPVDRARRIVLGSAALALLGGEALGVTALLLVVGMLALGYAYSGEPFLLKRSATGTAAVVLAGGVLTYLAGAGSTGGSALHGGVQLLTLVMALWMAGVGAITKDLPDVEGDLRAGRRTGAVRHGVRRQRAVAAVRALVLGVLFVLSAARWAPGLLVPAGMLLVGAVVLAAVCTPLAVGRGTDSARRPYRVFMVTQYAVHVGVLAMWVLSA